MRKELYEKLNFEERTMYRIENNSREFPEVNFGMLTFGIVASLIATALKSYSTALFIMKITIVFTIAIFSVEFIKCMLRHSKSEKEWTKKVIEKVGKK